MRKLSQIPATNLTDVFTTSNGTLAAHGLRAYDALAYDKVSASPCTKGPTETLLSERYSTPEGKVLGHSYTGANVRSVIAGGVHPAVNRRKWLEANADERHIQRPTGDNTCGKCGYDAYCTCPKPVWAGGAPVVRVKPEPPKPIVINSGLWLRDRGNGTYKVHAILV